MLAPGDLAPEIDAVTSTGARFKLSAQSKSLCTIVYFFPKAFTPGCTIETRRFRDNYPEMVLAGARLVGVSTDDHDTQCLFAQSLKTPFPIIGDADKKISRAYGVLWPILERPMRVTFVINPLRTIEAVLHHEINIAAHRDEVLRLMDAMRQRAASRIGSARPQAFERSTSETMREPPVARLFVGGEEPFTLVREAGAGGMGVVYLAREAATERMVALKILARQADPARFEREIVLLARLMHPNIVSYIGHGVADDGRSWLAMEWLEGESLSTTLKRGPIGVRESVRVAREVAAGLAAAHDAGIVHRDIKPSNVHVSSDGAVKILDFGIARPIDEVANALTRTGHIVGTPGYLAPEQARADRRIDGRTDLFALGCLLYRSVMGRRAFDAPDAIALMTLVLTGETPRLANVPPALDALSNALLAKDPNDRPPNAAAVVNALDAIARELDRVDPTLPM